MLAIGYTSGTILVYSLEEKNQTDDQGNIAVSSFELLHQFSFHKSPVTCLVFSDEDTQLLSGAADTYIIQYDLIASTAEFKLMGHTEPIT